MFYIYLIRDKLRTHFNLSCYHFYFIFYFIRGLDAAPWMVAFSFGPQEVVTGGGAKRRAWV